jgi:hypothetical protein
VDSPAQEPKFTDQLVGSTVSLAFTQPVKDEPTRARRARDQNRLVGIPFLAVVFGVIRFWARGIHLRDGSSLGVLPPHRPRHNNRLHRLVAHKSVTARRRLKLTLIAHGLMAYEAGPIDWVAKHRRHHLFAETANPTLVRPRRR